MFCSIIFLNNVSGQNDFDYSLKNTPDRIISEKEADSLLNIISSDSVIKKIKAAFIFSRIYYKQSKLNLAIKYAKTQNNLSQNGTFFPKHFHNSFYLIGKYYMRKNNIDSARIYFKKALGLKFYPKKIAQSLCHLAECYRMEGDLHKSLIYYKKGIDLLFDSGYLESAINHSINLSLTCNQIKTKKSALLGLRYLKKSDSILTYEKIFTNTNDLCFIYNNIGMLYHIPNNFNYNKAKNFYLKAINQSKIQDNNLIITSATLNIGELYLNKDLDSAFFYLKNSLTNSTNTDKLNQQALKSEIYRNLSRYYSKKRDLDSSLKNINYSINTSFEIPIEGNTQIKPNLFKNAISRRNIVLAFEGKLNILNYLYKKTQKKEYLEESINTVNLSDAFINYTIQNSTESNTKFLWRDDVSEIYNYGVSAAYNLGDNELMHSIIEKNKAFLLTQSVKENNTKLNLPYQVKTQLKKYRESILELESKSNQTLKDSIFEIKLSYDRFQDSIKNIYPEYFAKRNDISPISLNEVKNNLSNNSAILSYHVDIQNNNLFGLFASKEKTIHFKTDLTDKFKTLVGNYKKLISKPLIKKSEFQEFYTVSNILYQKLFPTKESKEFIKNKDLIILSNDILQNIPFETLNTQKDSLKYLIEDHNISYAYSASFLDFNNSLERTTSKNIAAFAPISFQNSNLKPLDATSSEIEAINKEISTDIYSQTNATKNNFLNFSSDYKILHLATHATSSDNPAIYFSKDTLKLHELYTHKTNTDLVVLSACESNLGEIKKGEGVFSLSRGFFYSGTKSVISSLWNVNDVSTADIMKNFYKNLNNHQSKSEALNNAKRTYLKEHSLSEKSPYYWASFVLIGDTSPTYPSPNYLIYILGFIGLFSIILFFFKKRG